MSIPPVDSSCQHPTTGRGRDSRRSKEREGEGFALGLPSRAQAAFVGGRLVGGGGGSGGWGLVIGTSGGGVMGGCSEGG